MYNTNIILSAYYLTESLENIIYNSTTQTITRNLAILCLLFLEKLMNSQLNKQ